jgi:hypothetical protein
MRIEIEIVSKDWTKDGPLREDQFHRNAASQVLRGMADRLANAGGTEARFDQGNGVIGTLEIVDE